MNHRILLICSFFQTMNAMEPSDISMDVEGTSGNPPSIGRNYSLKESMPFWLNHIYDELKKLREVEQERLEIDKDRLRVKTAQLALQLEKLQLSYTQKKSKSLDQLLIDNVRDLISKIAQKDGNSSMPQ